MSGAPGVYDQEAEMVMDRTNAASVVVIVVDGSRGHGFSVRSINPAFPQELPRLLREMADEIEPTVADEVMSALKKFAGGEG